MNNINRPLIGPHANQISQQDEINITRPPQKNVFSYMQAQDAAYLDFINTNWHLIPNSDFSLYQEPAFEQPSKFTLNQAENFGLSLQNPYLRPFNNENRAYVVIINIQYNLNTFIERRISYTKSRTVLKG